MSFAHPTWLWTLLLLPLLVALFVWSEHARSGVITQFVAARLEPRLASSASVGRRSVRFALRLLGLACAIVTLAQPRLGYTWEEQKQRGRDVLIAIDTSRSMLANDLAPTRLARAKLAAEDLIAQLGGDRVGLIAFAGSAFLQAPLTADHSAVLNAVRELDTEIIPQGGTNLAVAIRTAAEAFGKGESEHRALVIFTDGEELNEQGEEAARKLSGTARIFTVGLGSVEGTIITLTGRDGRTEYLKDPRGQIVKSRLDETRLRAIAEATGGFYVALRSGPAEMRQIARDGLDPMSEQDFDAQLARQPIERYQWPLSAGMALLAISMLIGERRRAAPRRMASAAALLAGAITFGSGEVRGAESGYQLYQEGRYAEAQAQYEKQLGRNPDSELLAFNLGAAAYKNGQLDRALDAFSKALTSGDPELRAKAEYNLGNTLFKRATASKKGPEMKGLEDALAHFDQARKLAPKHAAAEQNYETTRKLIALLKQQQEQKKQEEKKKEQSKQEQGKDEEKEQSDSGKDKEQQPQDGAKEEQKEGQKQPGQQTQDSKDDPGKGEQGAKEEQDGKEGESGEQKEGVSKEQENQDEQGKMGEEKPDAQDGKEGEPKEPDGEGTDENERKLSGELKSASSDEQGNDTGRDASMQAQAAEEVATGQEARRMEARALLESLRGEDEQVRLLNPHEHRRAERALRDW